ncbi:metal-sensitive transcriptional regulator [Spirochaeta lutea]|uniref:Transcriptional regulator n=1 Tax=Spirochaeta lutea TaxID=1480694 RepID=A0A098R303_9SPIO|nr:metal-sensitive transcriptional regulator [Spirochaeta lutea]KGE73117.1 hypothetical protein DC28_05335 [Spirochaeta lutea]
MTELKQKDLDMRLKRIEGQIGGIRNMIANERYCIDILTQTSAISSALRKVEELILQNHLDTCVMEAIRSGDPQIQSEKTNEILMLVSKFRKG